MLKKITISAVSVLSLVIASPLMAEPMPQLEGHEVGNGVIVDEVSNEKAIGWSSGGLIQENLYGIDPLEGFTSVNAMKFGD